MMNVNLKLSGLLIIVAVVSLVELHDAQPVRKDSFLPIKVLNLVAVVSLVEWNYMMRSRLGKMPFYK